MCVLSMLVFFSQEGRAVEAVADLSRAVEISDPSPAALHYLAKALKVSNIPSPQTTYIFYRFDLLLEKKLPIR